jgi:hypothetical protein
MRFLWFLESDASLTRHVVTPIVEKSLRYMRAFDLLTGNFRELTPTSVGAGVDYQYCQNGSLGMKVMNFHMLDSKRRLD